MKKIFILTGEPSGDKLASTVISKLKTKNSEIKYLSVGGSNLKKLGKLCFLGCKEEKMLKESILKFKKGQKSNY